jgi:hypothetical protein
LLDPKHAYINSLEKTAKKEELVILRNKIYKRILQDRYYYTVAPLFKTCFETYRLALFQSSKLLLSSETKESKGKFSNISSEIQLRRSTETDLERMYRETVEAEEI